MQVSPWAFGPSSALSLQPTHHNPSKMDTITLTFGDQAENHAGMQTIGTMGPEGSGYHHEDLLAIQSRFEALGCRVELHDLGRDAYLLIVRQGLPVILGQPTDDLYQEHLALHERDWLDKKAKMRGRVVQKRARWNVCFDVQGQEPDYEHGKGRIVAYDDVPLTQRLRERLPDYFGEKAIQLPCEGNYYYDGSKCGIGYHGDSERRKVIAVRLGQPMSLHYQWYEQSLPVEGHYAFNMDAGDLYVMSEKAVGTDWKKRKIPTLRHAAGCNTYTAVK